MNIDSWIIQNWYNSWSFHVKQAYDGKTKWQEAVVYKKQGSEEMIYIGVDIAKEKHYAAMLSGKGEVLKKPFGFTNTAEGFSKLAAFFSGYEKDELLIGMESTTHYGDNLLSWLYRQGYHVCLINPVQTAALRKTEIRKTKTDKTDSLLIVKSLIVNKHRLYTERDEELTELKTLCRFYRNVIQSKSRLKTQLVSEVGDVNRFSNPAKLLAYAGLDHTELCSVAFLNPASSTPLIPKCPNAVLLSFVTPSWKPLGVSLTTVLLFLTITLKNALRAYLISQLSGIPPTNSFAFFSKSLLIIFPSI